MPKNTVSVTRPGRYGNPWHKGNATCGCHKCLVVSFERHLERMPPAFILPLRGKNLACYCHEDQCCHADPLRVAANWSSAPADWKETFSNLRELGEAVDALADSNT